MGTQQVWLDSVQFEASIQLANATTPEIHPWDTANTSATHFLVTYSAI